MSGKMPVRDIDTGESWESQQAAAEALGVSQVAVHQGLRNHTRVAGRWLVADVDPPLCQCCREKIEVPMSDAEIAILKKRGLPLPAGYDLKDEVAAMIG